MFKVYLYYTSIYLLWNLPGVNGPVQLHSVFNFNQF